MADPIPAEAVQAAAEALRSHNHGFTFGCAICRAGTEGRARLALEAAAPLMAGAGSPTACPSVASESTESAQDPSAAPVYPPAPTKPAESLTAPPSESAIYDHIHAAITDNYHDTPVNPAAVATIATGAALAALAEHASSHGGEHASEHVDLRAVGGFESVPAQDHQAQSPAQSDLRDLRALLDGAGAVPGEHTAPETTEEAM